jgi:hypothetical protein
MWGKPFTYPKYCRGQTYAQENAPPQQPDTTEPVESQQTDTPEPVAPQEPDTPGLVIPQQFDNPDSAASQQGAKGDVEMENFKIGPSDSDSGGSISPQPNEERRNSRDEEI